MPNIYNLLPQDAHLNRSYIINERDIHVSSDQEG